MACLLVVLHVATGHLIISITYIERNKRQPRERSSQSFRLLTRCATSIVSKPRLDDRIAISGEKTGKPKGRPVGLAHMPGDLLQKVSDT
jgi:hypothetical protein